MVMGPAIDPPYPQNSYRPNGVYHYPDDRVGCEGRTVYELWANGECLACASASASARLRLEPRLWEFLDLSTDVPLAANDTTPRSLRVIR